MSKKTFSSAPKPNQPSPEEIAAFEQGGAGHDAKVAVVAPAEKPRSRVGRPSTSKKPKAMEVEVEPTKRLSLDLPASVHKRFKTACSATDRKMTDEVVRYIERRAAELEKQSGIYNSR